MPDQQPRHRIDPDDAKRDERERPASTKDAGRAADPIGSKAHREHRPGDELAEPELKGDDLAELAEDPLKDAEGPDA